VLYLPCLLKTKTPSRIRLINGKTQQFTLTCKDHMLTITFAITANVKRVLLLLLHIAYNVSVLQRNITICVLVVWVIYCHPYKPQFKQLSFFSYYLLFHYHNFSHTNGGIIFQDGGQFAILNFCNFSILVIRPSSWPYSSSAQCVKICWHCSGAKILIADNTVACCEMRCTVHGNGKWNSAYM